MVTLTVNCAATAHQPVDGVMTNACVERLMCSDARFGGLKNCPWTSSKCKAWGGALLETDDAVNNASLLEDMLAARSASDSNQDAKMDNTLMDKCTG